MVAAFVAGFIDGQVGGGGVITLPALLATGMPVHLALGTNKLAASGASAAASWQYFRSNLIERRFAWMAGLAFVGTAFGAWTVLRVRPRDVTILVIIVMLVMVGYVLARPKMGSGRATNSRIVVMAILAVAIGFYDGFLGPGTGTFLLFALTALLGLSLLRAAALGRLLNFASNIGALLVFAFAGFVDWKTGGVMLVGTISGGYVGSRVSIRGGTQWVRYLFVAVAVGLVARLVWTL